MIPSSLQKPFVSTLIGVLASGALYFFGTGLNGFGPFVLLAPVPVLVLAFRSSALKTIIVSVLAYAIGGLSMVSYAARLAPPGMVVASIAIPSVAFALAVIATRTILQRAPPWIACCIFPAMWTSYEYLLSVYSPHGTAGSLAYTLVPVLPLIQIASITGLWGITFIISFLPAGFAVAWHEREKPLHAIPAFALPVVLFVAVLVYGWIRLSDVPVGSPLSVGLASTDTTVQYSGTTKAEVALPVVDQYVKRVERLAIEGAQIVILPEKFVGVTKEYDTTMYRMFRETADENRVYIIAGLNNIEPLHNVNTVVVFSPVESSILMEYDKRYLMPGLEAKYRAGSMPRSFQIKKIKAGIEICKDMDFPAWSRQYGKMGAKIVFVPAWDFGEDRRLHSNMAIMRGVENGFSVVRCAQEGLLTVSDDRGRIIAEESSSSSPEVMLLSAAYPGSGSTFYTVSGDWFAWTNIVFLGVYFPLLALWILVKSLKKFRGQN